MTLTFDHTHDPDQEFQGQSEIALSQEWVGRLTWNETDVSHSIMTMTLTSVTMVGGRTDQIMNRVTSDVGMSSAHLV